VLTEPLILLAGGRSRRAGQPKGLRDFRGRPWIVEQLERFSRAGGSSAVVVLGRGNDDGYREVLAAAALPGLELRLALNPAPDRGTFSSLQEGLRALREGSSAFILPVDVPAPEARVWVELSRAGALGEAAAISSTELGGGHPVWLSGQLVREILELPDTSRLDLVLKSQARLKRVRVDDPSVGLNLNTSEEWDLYERAQALADDAGIGHDAGVLALVEVGLGSVVHAFHLPGGGHLLSLNQAFFLARSTLRTRMRAAAVRISSVVGLLKSLSPAGSRLTPMLAISAQGALFSAGTGAFGANLAGVCVGAALLSVWAFAQPLAVSYLIFGRSLFEVAAVLYQRAAELLSFPRSNLWQVLALLVFIKAVLAMAVAALARFLPESWVSAYTARLRAAALRTGTRSRPGRLGFLRAPIFLVPLALNFIFLFWAESPRAAFLWGLLRPVALGYVAVLVLRTISAKERPRSCSSASPVASASSSEMAPQLMPLRK
jgi:CTP:molybdopterin cytidylyltransferase MocA